MTRNAITGHYLAEVARRGVGPAELTDATQRHLDLEATSYRGRTLPRPAFLDRAEVARLDEDLRNLQDALYALPHRLFGGDIGAFARAAGMNPDQVTAVLRGRGPAPTRMGRADIYHDGEHFRLMELNLGSALGGLDNAMVNPTFLTHPFFAEFVAEHGLAYVDTIEELVRTLLVESDVPAGQRPLVAAVDWPASFDGLEERLKASAAVMAPFGVDVVPCHLGMLEFHDGRVWLRGRPVDVVYRLFLIEDLLDPAGPGSSNRCCGPWSAARCGSSPRWTQSCTATRPPLPWSPTRPTGTTSAQPSGPASTGCCRGPRSSGTAT